MSSERSAEQTQSVWSVEAPGGVPRSPLTENATADVCIVGAGIAGLSTAYELIQQGKSVIVVDAGCVGSGETQRTSAHLSSVIDDRFFRIEEIHGEEAAKLCYQSHSAAIDWYERVAAQENIECDFERVDGYLFLPPNEKTELLDREFSAAQRAGFEGVEQLGRAPLHTYDTGPCLRFPRQAQFEPVSFLMGLAKVLEGKGCRICCNTRVNKVERQGKQLLVRCENDVSVKADAVVIATNSPINDIVTMHTKQHAFRTYVIALPITKNSMPHALYWDTAQEAGELNGPYHYVRVCRSPYASEHSDHTHDLLLVGGEDHRTGQADDAPVRWQHLETWAQARFQVRGRAEFRWSGQVMEPVDHMAFIGPNPTGPDGIYIVTGDSGMGLTHGAIAGMLLTDLIMGRSNAWAKMYDPSRRTLRTVLDYARENLNVTAQYMDWLMPGEAKKPEQIRPGQGAVIREGLKLLACYRDPQGELHIRSAACPHLGGVVRWNAAEKTWDCPCHGSRFDTDGEVLNGPAISPLACVHEHEHVESGTT